ncbi:MAG: type III pantothenate kinase [Culicoidibacterales bacterium]
MAILAINIGNTNIHLGVEQNGNIIEKTVRLQDESCDAYIKEAIDFFSQKNDIDTVKLSSVNPEYTAYIADLITSLTMKQVEIIQHGSTGWKVDYEQYENGKLGLDRMLVCEAVYARKKVPAIIFDFGTATTMNVIDEKGVFLGGSIFPGVYMGIEALQKRTAQLPHTELSAERKVPLLGKTTQEAMQSAALYGAVSMVEGMIERVQNLMPIDHVFITGGAAKQLQPYFSKSVIYEEYLVIEGILALNQ